MNVAIFGGTGFIGSHVIDRLVADGHRPRPLVREGSEARLRHPESCDSVTGDIDDAAAVREACSGAEAAIYLIGILREDPARGVTFEALQYEGACRAIDAAKACGVRHFLLMSANGVTPDGTDYQRTKFRAEEYLRRSGLPWTVFRPSVVFGDPRGRMEFATQLYRDVIRPALPAPLFFEGIAPTGAGRFRLSPVNVLDVAAAYSRALERDAARNRVIPLCGPDALEWKQILQTLAAVAGRRKLYVPAPAWGVRAAAAALDRFAFFPVTRDQLAMLLEGNVCDAGAMRETLGIDPRRFTRSELAYLGRDGQ